MNFSVVIPVFNKQQTIHRAIYSVLDQIRAFADDVQLIIVDDGSTDNSLATVKNIIENEPSRNIEVHCQQNAGVSAARNSGIEQAQYDLVAFLDADDTYETHFLDEISRLVNEYPESAAYCTAYRFVSCSDGSKRDAIIKGLRPDRKRQALDDFFFSAANGDLPLTSSSVCIRKPILERIGGFPKRENMGEDQALWSQLALLHGIAISKKMSANYFQETGNSLMQTVEPDCEMPFSQRLQKQLDLGSIPTKMRVSVKRYIAGHLLDLVRRNIESGNLVTAKRLIDDNRTRADLKRWFRWKLVFTVKAARARLSF
ncbi:MAG: glycosyltransferase involved in cell wall biosynthesis [Arenicella sp.]|jgi:glycosyltransferase involved in cell wall biosynthesis